MINVAVVTNLRAPYRKLQLEELSKIEDIAINVYYTNTDFLGRKWNVAPIKNVNETVLKGRKVFKETCGYVYLNKISELKKAIKSNELILLGANVHPSHLIAMGLCKLNRKSYGIIYDGISPLKIEGKENKLKMFLKKIYFKNSSLFFANGTSSRRYFNEKFNIDNEKIFNQKLAVDTNYIMGLLPKKEQLRSSIRERYNIAQDQNVVIYSGRIVNQKKINTVIEAINLISFKKDITFLIVGDGEERSNIEDLAKKLNVNLIVTGYISEQKELFEHYFAGDIGILPSEEESWGLVINEEMSSGLPIIASEECGAVLDLVKKDVNGYVIQVGNIQQIATAIEKILTNNKDNKMGQESISIISEWTVDKSKESFESLLEYAKKNNLIK